MDEDTRKAAIPPALDTYKGAFHALGRLLTACSNGWQGLEMPEPLVCEKAPAAPAVAGTRPRSVSRLRLADLADGPYYCIVDFLGSLELGRTDAACRLTRDLNRMRMGPWWALGQKAFLGLELDGDAIFDPGKSHWKDKYDERRRKLQVDWKCRFLRYACEVKMFRTPFSGSEITTVQQADEIAYARCKLRTDILEANADVGVYLEVEVMANPDNVSLAVVDFEAGGCSSVTFSPDTGAVIRERKIREAPRKVEGTYIQPLTTITSGQGFEGSMGLFLQNGRLAFFRRHVERASEQKAKVVGAWESTGFVTDLSWAEGRQLTPCLAFRDVGDYNLRTTRIDSKPPVPMTKNTLAYAESLWRSLDWDAGEHEALET